MSMMNNLEAMNLTTVDNYTLTSNAVYPIAYNGTKITFNHQVNDSHSYTFNVTVSNDCALTLENNTNVFDLSGDDSGLYQNPAHTWNALLDLYTGGPVFIGNTFINLTDITPEAVLYLGDDDFGLALFNVSTPSYTYELQFNFSTGENVQTIKQVDVE